MQRKVGRGPKDKGRSFENEVSRSILEAFPQLSLSDVQCRAMGDPGIDILLSEAARKIIPFAMELKRTERLNLPEAFKQAEANAMKECLKPAVVSRRNHEEARVTILWKDLLMILGANL